MQNRLGCVLVLAFTALAVSVRPALAQQTLNLSWGDFMLRGVDRVESDILLIEHHDLMFDISDFGGPIIGGEWLVPIGELFEAGIGASFSRRTVPTVHKHVVNSDGSAVSRELGFRQMPLAFTVRLLPLGQSYSVQPYVGGGVAVIVWGFSESGDWAEPNQQILRGEKFETVGIASGSVVLVGLRVARDVMAVGFEARYQRARGSFGGDFARVQDPDIDFNGWILQITTGIRLGR